MCKVITVSNQKGGTAKTTSCVNLGIGLASAGKKVLLIDTDPQGSLSISLGYPEPDEECGPGGQLRTVLCGRLQSQHGPVRQGIPAAVQAVLPGCVAA